MDKNIARTLAFNAAIKEAAFGQAAAEGAVKTIGGAAKKMVGGKWVAHSPGSGGAVMDKLKGLFTSSAPAATKPLVKSVNVAKARMGKLGSAADLEIVKEGKNRLGKAIEAAKAVTGGNTLANANRVAGLKSIQEATKPAAAAVGGRFKDIADTIKARPKLRNAALGLLREKRI